MIGLLAYAGKAALGVAVFYGLYAAFLRNETHFAWNRAFLVGGLALSFLIPAVPVPSPFRTVAAAGPGGLSAAPAPEPAGALFAGPGFGPLDALAIVYAAGVLACLLRFGARLARLAGLVLRNGVRRRDGLRLVPVGPEHSPFSFLNLVFLDDRGLDPGDVRWILAHERVHVRQLHSLDLLLAEAAAAALWFQPLVRPFKKALQETHEYLADAGVAAQGFGGRGYRRLVFEQHVGARLFGVGNSFRQSQIIRRIAMMSRQPSAGGSRWKCLLAVPAALALVVAFSSPRRVSASPAQEKADQTHAVSKEKAALALDELRKLSVVEKDLKAKFEAAKDDAERREIKAKFETVAKQRQELIQACNAAGIPLPPPADAVKQQKELDLAFKQVQAELETTQDPARKAELEHKLQQIKMKSADLSLKLHGPSSKTPSLEDIQAFLANLQAKEADLRAAIDKAETPEQKDELKKKLEAVLQKEEGLKAMAKEAEAAKKAEAEKK